MFFRLTILLLLLAPLVGIQGQTTLWTDVPETSDMRDRDRKIIPNVYRTLRLDAQIFRAFLDRAPEERTVAARKSPVRIPVPNPNGGIDTFSIVEYPLLAAALQSAHPDIRTYRGFSTTDPFTRIRLDWTTRGFHAMVVSPGGSWFVDPYSRANVTDYIAYQKRDLTNIHTGWICQTTGIDRIEEDRNNRAGDCVLRTYELVVATTGEYANFHGASTSGTPADQSVVLSEVTTAINRVNEIYEQDLSIRLVLIPSTVNVFFYDGATDPYTNSSGSTMLGENQTTCDNIIGFSNYDIGHVFSTGGGGIASLYGPCNSNKARGVTGLPNPTGDPFYVDYVAHEIGHQFGALHTFNGTAGSCNFNASASSAYEPGSGSTIMAYAGICSPQNVQLNSDPYFHAKSLQEVADFVSGSGNACQEPDLSFNNNPPSVDAGPDYTIPVSTPFVLTATATDPDGDPIVYCWEQYDLESPRSEPPDSNDPDGPLFRSFEPGPVSQRYFPNLSDLASGTATPWEVLPSVSRTMQFRVTGRDFHNIAGCTDEDDVIVTTSASAGPFVVTSPNTNVTWTEGDVETVSWNVAATDQAPVNCTEVDILLSYDGGVTFPVSLANNVPNTGSATVTLPAGITTTARIMVIASDNIFFDISNTDFEIEIGLPDYSLNVTPNTQIVCPLQNSADYTIQVGSIGNYQDPVTLNINNVPSGSAPSLGQNPVVPGSNTILTFNNLDAVTPGIYIIEVEGTSSAGVKNVSCTIEIKPFAQGPALLAPADSAPDIALEPQFEWNPVPDVAYYELQVAEDTTFSTIVVSDISTATEYVSSTALSPLTTHYWRVRGVDTCGEGSWSAIRVFVTAGCFTYMASDLPISISPSGSPTITSTLSILDAGQILDVNVIDLEGIHSWVGDLTFTLSSPVSTEVLLIDRICSSQDDFDINLDDETNPGNPPCPPTDGLDYQPEGLLSSLDGENVQGDWILTVEDNINQDGGSLDKWGLQICIADYACNKTVFNANASGPGSFADALDCAAAGDTVRFDPAIYGSTLVISGPIEFPDGVVLLSAPSENITIDASNIPVAFDLQAGTEAEIHGITILSGTSANGSAITNLGELLLKDVTIQVNPSFPNHIPIHNSGTLNLEGQCQLIE